MRTLRHSGCVPDIKILLELVLTAQLFAENRKPKAFFFPSGELQKLRSFDQNIEVLRAVKKKRGLPVNIIRYQTAMRPACLGKSNP